ncbi:MAG: hypothetical protein WAM92_11955 [Mycobacterium sp.]
MAFKLTYSDGQADDYDDSTKWAVEDGILKMGRESGEWTVLVSPSHWATIEVRSEKDDDRKDEDKDKDDSDKDKDDSDKDKDDKDDDDS